MNITRLHHLRTIAERLDMKYLDMGLWGGCFTSACLAGWACRDEDFIAQGLHIDEAEGGQVPTFEEERSFQALDKFFNLHGLETTHLFSPIAYSAKPTRKELLQHIDVILAGTFIEKFGARFAERGFVAIANIVANRTACPLRA